MLTKSRILPFIGLGLVALGWLTVLLEAWPVLTAQLDPLQWFSLGAIHVGAIGMAFEAVRKSYAAAAPLRSVVLVLAMTMMMSWCSYLSLLNKIGKHSGHSALTVDGHRDPRRIGEERGQEIGAVHRSPVKIWAQVGRAA
jgi:hypothetical protein